MTHLEPCHKALDRALTPKAEPSDAALRRALQASLAVQGKRSCSKCGHVGLIAEAFSRRTGKVSYWCRACERDAVERCKNRAKAKAAETEARCYAMASVIEAICNHPDEFAATGPCHGECLGLEMAQLQMLKDWADAMNERAHERSQ